MMLLKKKAGKTLARGFAPQQQHSLLGLNQFTRGFLHQAVFKLRKFAPQQGET